MQITVDLPDDFAKEVRAAGFEPRDYVRGVIDDLIRAANERSGPIHRQMAIREFLERMASFSDKIPVLPDEAFTRESFYQDRD